MNFLFVLLQRAEEDDCFYLSQLREGEREKNKNKKVVKFHTRVSHKLVLEKGREREQKKILKKRCSSFMCKKKDIEFLMIQNTTEICYIIF